MRRLLTGAAALTLLLGWSSAAHADVTAKKVAPQASAGCKARTKLKKGEQRAKMSSGGEDRFYYRFVPRAYNGKKPLPVVVDLHGHTDPVAFHKNSTALGPFGDKKGFITITPQGSGPPPKWETEKGAADLQFVVDLLDVIEEEMCVDTRRIFMTGYSNGAMVTSVFACDHADRIAAVAPVSGIREVPGCEPARPIPVVAFHGVDDEWIAYNGGYGPGVYSLDDAQTAELIRSGEATYSDLSIPEVAAAWAARNGCDPAPTEKKVSEDTTRIRYTCPNHADVELYATDGAGHTWPGSKLFVALEPFIGPTTLEISANEIMWKFFQRHPLREA